MSSDEETKWREEFTAVGETQLRHGMNTGSMPFPEPKRQFAFRWVSLASASDSSLLLMLRKSTNVHLRMHNSV
jgi:hypothetical protein